MRLLVLATTLFTLAACGEQAAAPLTAATPAAAEVSAAPSPAIEVTDANALTTDEISARLVGAWRSTQDDKSTLTISADGKWTSGHEGEAMAASDWKVFAGDAPPAGAAGPFTPASRYLEVKDADGVFYYELGHITADAFDMFYTARGNNLGFVRVQ